LSKDNIYWNKKNVSPDIQHLQTDKGPIVGCYLGADIASLTTSDKLVSLIHEKLNYPKNSIYIRQDHKSESRKGNEKLNYPKNSVYIREDHKSESRKGNKKIEKNYDNKEETKITIGQRSAIWNAIGDSLKNDKPLLIQEAVEGKEYRAYIIKGVICSVIERVFPYVFGDGEHTVKQLIEIQQSLGIDINIQQDLIENLKKLHLTLESIPEKNRRLNLRSTSNPIKAKDVTDLVHSSFKIIFEKLYKKLAIIQVGVDLVCDDISKDIKEQQYYIIDWDNGFDLMEHQYPQYGQPRNVFRAILGHAFPELQSHPLYHTQGGPAPNPFKDNQKSPQN